MCIRHLLLKYLQNIHDFYHQIRIFPPNFNQRCRWDSNSTDYPNFYLTDKSASKVNRYSIGMCCFSTKHAALMSKNKDLTALNQDNVSEWSELSTRGLLFQWVTTIKFQLTRHNMAEYCSVGVKQHSKQNRKI